MFQKTKVYQFNKEGEKINEYESISDAARTMSVDRKSIKKAILRNGNSCGFAWRITEDLTSKAVIKDPRLTPITINPLKTKEQKLAEKIIETYSIAELETLAKGCRIMPGTNQIPKVSFEGTKVKFCAVGDLHIGSIYTHDEHIKQMFLECEKENIDFITIGGDITEGFSNRDGHVYEQSHIGYNAQKAHAIKLLSCWTKTPMYLIAGNHDLWYVKSAGAHIVKDICKEIPNAEFLGDHQGIINLNDKTTLMMWHGEDSSSYALSYRLQKVVESLTGGTKPGIMLFHHTHKFCYIFERHIHCISAGSIQMQSSWMKNKRLAAHTGFCIIELTLNNTGVVDCQVTWKPFYA